MVQIRFPVWRELKLSSLQSQILVVWFRYAFPFEGNWNTITTVVNTAAKMFRYAFPFEGNWNATKFVYDGLLF